MKAKPAGQEHGGKARFVLRKARFVKNDEQSDPSKPKKTIVFYVLSFHGREVSKQFSDFEALKAQLTQVGFRAANSRDPGPHRTPWHPLADPFNPLQKGKISYETPPASRTSARTVGSIVRPTAAHGAVAPGGLPEHQGHQAAGQALRKGEKDAELAQTLGQLKPLIAVFPQECMGQLAYFGPT